MAKGCQEPGGACSPCVSPRSRPQGTSRFGTLGPQGWAVSLSPHQKRHIWRLSPSGHEPGSPPCSEVLLCAKGLASLTPKFAGTQFGGDSVIFVSASKMKPVQLDPSVRPL